MAFIIGANTVIDNSAQIIVGSGATRPNSPPPQLFGWGHNTYGQLGDGTSGAGTSKSSPVSVIGGFTDWINIRTMTRHTAGIRSNGTAWCWGYGGSGRLGDGTTSNRSSPVSVVGGFTDWVQISAGTNHTLGLRSDGTVWGWGAGPPLGQGNYFSRNSPVSVIGGFTDWIHISAGSFSAAIRSNGTAWCWGTNSWGQLGDGTTSTRTSPVSVLGGFTDWTQINASYNSHAVALRSSGTAWCWGRNDYGQLGDGTTSSRSSPVSVIGGFTDWTQVSAGRGFGIGIRSNGAAWAWGQNNRGQLGNNSTTNTSSPVSVVGGFTDWTRIVGGSFHSFGIRSNNTAWSWGRNLYGQLGDGTSSYRSSPVSVVGSLNWTTNSNVISAGISTVGVANALGLIWFDTTTGRLIGSTGGTNGWTDLTVA